jgi:riboflavin synthase
MFTGIIQEIGIIEKISSQNDIKSFTIKAPALSPLQKIGSSISVDGACLTVVAKTDDTFTVEAVPETLERTIAGKYNEQQSVNLEPSLKIGDGLDGHFVSGHVDFTSKILDVQNNGDAKIITIEFPENMGKFFAFKGSVTINGVSLTISKLNTQNFEVNIIPHTQKVTTIGTLEKNDEVNIEIDLLTRYLDNLLKNKEQEASFEFLKKRGFI